MSIRTELPPGATWRVTVTPADGGEAARRLRMVEELRPALERRVQDHPKARAFTWQTPLLRVEAHLRSGPPGPGSTLQIVCDDEPSLIDSPPPSVGAPAALPGIRLPSDEIQGRGQRLVGLDGPRERTLLLWRCRWDGIAEAWSERNCQPLPPALRAHLKEPRALMVFEGPPGTGKSVLAHAVADQYCRENRISGHLLRVGTEVRGNGLVNDFSQRLRAAFQAIQDLPRRDLRCLLIDEADALAMRRSEAQAHQEDRVGTDTLLQSLDALVGEPRLAVLLTTNLVQTIDAAVLRRSAVVHFGLPDAAARRELLSQWVPGLTGRELARAAGSSRGMSPADIERTLSQSWFAALAADMPLSARQVLIDLRRAERTGRV